jgi:hypothetical protein
MRSGGKRHRCLPEGGLGWPSDRHRRELYAMEGATAER